MRPPPALCAGGIGLPRAFGRHSAGRRHARDIGPSRAFRGPPYTRGLGPRGRSAGLPPYAAARGAAASRGHSATHAARRTSRGLGHPRAFRDPCRPSPHAGHRPSRPTPPSQAFRRPPAPALTPPQRAFPASRLAASAPAWYTVRNPCTKEDATDDRFPALPASAPPHGHAAGVGAVDLRAVSAAGRDLAGHRAQRLCHLSRLVGRAGLLAQSFHLGRRGPAHRLQRPAGGVRPRGHAGRARLYGGDALRLVCQALRAELSYHRHL